VLSVRPPLAALAAALCLAACGPASGSNRASVDGGSGSGSPSAEATTGRDEPGATLGRLTVIATAAEDGTPLAGAAIVATPIDPRRPRSNAPAEQGVGAHRAVAGGDGTASFELEPGAYEVALEGSPDGAEPVVRVDLKRGERREQALRAPTRAAHDVALRVVADEDDRALAGVALRVDGVPPYARGARATGTSAADGSARVRVPAWCATSLAIAAPGRGEVRVALPLESELDAPVRLIRTAELRGRLVTTAGGPVVGVPVEARVAVAELYASGRLPRDPRAARAVETIASTTSGENGAFTLELPAYTGVMLEAPADDEGGRPRRSVGIVRLEPGESADQDFVLKIGTRIEGTLLGSDDAPIARAPVWLVRGGARSVFTRFEEIEDRTVTDDEGRFAFLGVEPGTWRIGPAPRRGDGEAPIAVPALLDVVPGMPRAEVVVRPPDALYITGYALDEHGAPVAGIGVIAVGDGQSARATSGDDGAFRIGPFASGEVVLRTAPAAGLAPTATNGARAGDRDVELRVVRTGAVRGAVHTHSGAPPVDTEVRLEKSVGARPTGVRSAAIDVAGAFLVADAEPGTYVVIARAEPDLVAAESVDVVSEGTAEVELALASGARARCRLDPTHAPLGFVVYADGLPVERGRVEGRTELFTRDFPAGELTVELHGPNGLVDRRTAETSAGRTVDLNFVR